MAKIHVLAGGRGIYNVVVHTAVPAGNNTVGVSWKNALIGAGLNVTSMPEGVGPGQISPAEKAQIEAGDIVEGRFVWGDIPGATNPELVADINTRADQLIAEMLVQFAIRLRYFGYSAG